jgi:(p)ppGpp synthase/HD superfamily hydrolase
MEYTDELVKDALAFAKEAHTDQLYGKKDYFSTHIMGVVDALKEGGADNLTLIVGALHDILEDTGVSSLSIVDKFGEYVYTLLWSLTRHGEKDYFDYIRKIKEMDGEAGDIVRRVKMEDVAFNYMQSVFSENKGFQARYARYARALFILLGYNRFAS